MRVNLELVPNLKEIEVLIKASKTDDELNLLLKKLSDEKPKIIIGFNEDKASILLEADIVKIFSANKKVYAKTKSTEFQLKIPLYEALERVNQEKFIRISNTEIVNLSKIIEFDLSFTGTICIKLSNGDISYVSRRYVSSIKKTLGLGGK